MEPNWEIRRAGEPWSRSFHAQILADEARFLAAWPEYESTRILDELRATELSRLDRLRHVYMDYTGGGLYGDSQVRRHA